MKSRGRRVGFYRHLSVLPSIGLALLPRLACPCQIPAYAGLLGSFGLTFLLQTVYLFPLMAACLTFSVGGLAVGASRRQGYLPFGLGLTAALLLMIGKFVIVSDGTMYVAIAMLLVASLWNAWPSRNQARLRIDADGQVHLGTDSTSEAQDV